VWATWRSGAGAGTLAHSEAILAAVRAILPTGPAPDAALARRADQPTPARRLP
jgi:hypothetical protein